MYKGFAHRVPSIDFQTSSLNVAVYSYRIFRSSENFISLELPILNALFVYKIESFQLNEDFLLRGLLDPC